MKQQTKEQQINHLYVSNSENRPRVKSAMRSSNLRQSGQGQSMSPRRLTELIELVKKAKAELKDSTIPKSGKELKQLTEKYLNENETSPCLTKKCSVKDVQTRLRERQETDRLNKIKKLLKKQLNLRESSERWTVTRSTSRILANQIKRRDTLDLIHRQRQWRSQKKLQQMAHTSEKQFIHGLNKQKIEMVRHSKKQNHRVEGILLKQLEKQSWRNMKFKEYNQMRLSQIRKQWEYDPLNFRGGLTRNKTHRALKSAKTQ